MDTVARALAQGAVGIADFTDAAVVDPGIRAISTLVEVVTDPEIERDWSRNISPTRLVVETDQAVFEARVDHPLGNIASPMQINDFDVKMKGCLVASGLEWPESAVGNLRVAVSGLGAGAGVSDLIRCLKPGRS